MTQLDIFMVSILVFALLISWQALTVKRLERKLDVLTRFMNVTITIKPSVTLVEQTK